jgi:hypothetical protein
MNRHIINFLTWEWVKSFLYWIVVSAGTISECVFLLASIWTTINATVHPLMLEMMTEHTTVTLTELSLSAFTGLPEIILGIAVVTTYGHIKMYCIHRKNSALTWAILFGIPTLIFAMLTLWTLTLSALKVGYELPNLLIATRVLAGYIYGFMSMLYMLIGKPDNADFISGLKSDIESLKSDIATQHLLFSEERNRILSESKTEIDRLQSLINIHIVESQKLHETASRAGLQSLENYPNVILELVNTGAKTVLYDDIPRLTGHSKQRLAKAKLQRTPRNKDFVVVSSLIEWLRSAPLPASQNGIKEGDTDPIGLHIITL